MIDTNVRYFDGVLRLNLIQCLCLVSRWVSQNHSFSWINNNLFTFLSSYSFTYLSPFLLMVFYIQKNPFTRKCEKGVNKHLCPITHATRKLDLGCFNDKKKWMSIIGLSNQVLVNLKSLPQSKYKFDQKCVWPEILTFRWEILFSYSFFTLRN